MVTFDRDTKARRPRIFLVDDDPDLRFIFKIGLEKHGFVVDIFSDPTVVLSNFKTGTYDLLLLDIKMPKMNEFELYSDIEKIDSKVKVCFITAFVVYYESLRDFPKDEGILFYKKANRHIHPRRSLEGGTMGQIPIAPADPMFWMHHANIDRIWSLWQKQNPDKNPTLTGVQATMDPWTVTEQQTRDLLNFGYIYV